MAVDLPNPESFMLLPQGDESNSITTSCIWGEQELSLDSASSELDTSCSEATADDDYIAGLAQQMAEYIIQDDDDQASTGSYKHPKTWSLATSPQSTLWSPFGSEPVKEKQRLVGGVPETEYPQLQKGNNKKARQQKRLEILDSQNKERPKPQQSLPYPGPGLPQQPAGTRPVFLSGSGPRSGSSGTGVFLPRGNNPSPSRKKLGCSRVVIPARVAQALKLHFDHVGLVSKPVPISPSAGPDASNEHENNANPQLPQEWTY